MVNVHVRKGGLVFRRYCTYFIAVVTFLIVLMMVMMSVRMVVMLMVDQLIIRGDEWPLLKHNILVFVLLIVEHRFWIDHTTPTHKLVWIGRMVTNSSTTDTPLRQRAPHAARPVQLSATRPDKTTFLTLACRVGRRISSGFFRAATRGAREKILAHAHIAVDGKLLIITINHITIQHIFNGGMRRWAFGKVGMMVDRVGMEWNWRVGVV